MQYAGSSTSWAKTIPNGGKRPLLSMLYSESPVKMQDGGTKRVDGE